MGDPDKLFYENLPFHGMQNPPNKNAFYTLTTPTYKNNAKPPLPQQYSATVPHQKHIKLIPRSLFQEQQISKSKSFSSKTKQKKHFQIPLQKYHSFKFQTAESYFQPIKNIHEENLMRNGYASDLGSVYRESHHNNYNHHHSKKDAHKMKGSFVIRRPNEYQENIQFQENMQNSVQLQYPQPVLASRSSASTKSNGIVYADLDIAKKSSSSANSSFLESTLPLSKPQTQSKTKPKTEYATLKFNDVGQEIDV
ncbi:hypothetical protein AMK59_211 [Oryctes borbonicus]|uniref:Uncharacterized protein n=1 Tax=Oryctes borbonicus TaxID=1629725 RepID=A0A0T6B9W5_9SCAR|nr:hypothetical protein AMK59_211 [Oryctes borbonicus]